MRGQTKQTAVLLLCAALGFSGCGTVETENPSDEITLIEPVNANANTEKVALHNLYDFEVTPGYLYPEITEYSFAEDTSFSGYKAAPGTEVTAGSILASADVQGIEDRIQGLKEQSRNLTETFEEEIGDLKSLIKEQKELIEEKKEKQEKETEEEKVFSNRQIGLIENTIRGYELTMRQKEELYELDLDYCEKQLEYLHTEEKSRLLYSDTNGVVVSVGSLMPGDYVTAKKSVAAVADTSKLMFICSHIGQSQRKKAQEFYLYVNGTAYELGEETERGASETEDSSFPVIGDTGALNVGDFGVLVAVCEKRENVVAVPKSALQKGVSGMYVYRIENGEKVMTDVVTGMSDGVYTEILSGVSVGDEVSLSESAISHGKESASVSYGDIFTEFEESGFFDCPITHVVKNPAEVGTTCLVEYKKELFSYVNKGEVIAEIRVETDAATKEELKKKIEREEARIRDAGTFENEKEAACRQKNLKNYQEELEKLETAEKFSQICADESGILVWVMDKKQNETIASGETVAVIADEKNCYVAVPNENGLLNLGNDAQVSYQDKLGNTTVFEGNVVNASAAGLSDDLETEDAYIGLPREIMEKISDALATGGAYRTKLSVKAQVREMKGVLTVPKDAVKRIAGAYYVTIRREDGTYVNQSIIVGGNDAENYWILDGLEEGMVVCLE